MHSSDLSFVSLILNASVVVQLVMAMLVLASVLSWTIIFDRSRVLRRAQREAEEFEDRFWSGGDLGDLYVAADRLDFIAPLDLEYQEHGECDMQQDGQHQGRGIASEDREHARLTPLGRLGDQADTRRTGLLQ